MADQETPFNDARSTGSNPGDPTTLIPSPSSLALVPAAPTSRHWSRIQTLMLSRLTRLVRMEEEWRHRVAPDDWRIRLIHKAIYSSFCDCIAAGVADEAKLIVRHGQSERLS